MGSSGEREDDPRATARGGGGRHLRVVQRGDGRGRARSSDHRRGGSAPARDRAPHDPLLRRDPSLQQGPAGCLPAPRGGRHGDSGRRDHGEPVVRGGAAPPFPGTGIRSRAPLHRLDPRHPLGRGELGARPRGAGARYRSGGARLRGGGVGRRRAPRARRAGGRRAPGRAGRVVARRGAAAREALQHRFAAYDKSGEEHYNLISALHKSVRGEPIRMRRSTGWPG